MTLAPPLQSIAVGVLVERSKALSQWSDYFWRPSGVLLGVPETPAWTQLSGSEDRVTFYAGPAEIALHRSDAPNYRENLESGAPSLWIGLRPSDGDGPYEVLAVTVDPAEGEGMTETGNNLVERIPMPPAVLTTVAAFVAEHPSDRQFFKRKRDRANTEGLARRGPMRSGDR